MADWSQQGGGTRIIAYPVANSVYHYYPTGHASAHTKGSWVECIASTPIDVEGIVVARTLHQYDGASLFDIGIGSGGSEVIIAENLITEGRGYSNDHIERYHIPIALPSGTRIAIRLQTLPWGGSKIGFNFQLIGRGGFYTDTGFAVMETWGADTSDTGGTVVDAGAVADTKGAWTEIAASTTYDCKAIMGAITSRNNAGLWDSSFKFDIGVGAGASEEVVIGDIVKNNKGTQLWPTQSHWMPVNIPAGSRIAARSQCTNNDATDRLLDIILYGVS